MIRKISVITICVLSLLLTGCEKANEQKLDDVKTTEVSEISQPAETESQLESTETEAPELTKLSYTIDYHKISQFYRERNNEKIIEVANKVIDEFLKFGTEVETPGMSVEELSHVHTLVREMCPPFVAFCDVIYDWKTVERMDKFHWKYRKSREEIEKEMARFEKEIEKYMADVYEEDTEAMKALNIYYAYSKEMSYDYGALGENSEGEITEEERMYRLTPFCAIADHSGICFSISEGLAFLYNLAGINAGDVESYEGIGAHAWTIAEIDNKYYYADATWDIRDDDGDSLMYFGMTAKERADNWGGSFPEESVEFACREQMQGKYDISDTRFEALHDSKYNFIFEYEVDHVKQEITITTANDEKLTLDMSK